MKKTEIRKAFSTRNRLKKEVKMLSDKLWKTSMSSPQFDSVQERLKNAQKELNEQYPIFQKALVLTLCPGTEEPK
jgi:uncharacterized coiled-coil DUF342 family protein